MRQQIGPDRNAEQARQHENQNPPPQDLPPNQVQRLKLGNSRAKNRKRRGHGRRYGVEPKPHRGDGGAKAGETVDDAAGQCAGNNESDLLGSHARSLFRSRPCRHPRSPTIWPPSATMVVPVTKRPASETSKSSGPSRSRSSPKRPIGISRLSASPFSLIR